MTNEVMIVKCPTCLTEVVWDRLNLFRPFCSKRCQLIDLGEWANEEKCIPCESELSENDHWSEQFHSKD